MVERYVRDVEAAGSNPVTPIFLEDMDFFENPCLLSSYFCWRLRRKFNYSRHIFVPPRDWAEPGYIKECGEREIEVLYLGEKQK